MIDRPELHSHVTFYAEDQHGKHKILLNKEPRLLAAVIAGCPKFLDVLVTEGQGILNRIVENINQDYKSSYD